MADGRPTDTPRGDRRLDPRAETDIIIIRLRAARRSWRRIGPVVGLTHEGARKRYHAIPEPVRRHFARVALS